MRQVLYVATAILIGCFMLSTASAADDKDALIKDALSAASPEIAKNAAVMDWDHSTLKKGLEPIPVCRRPREIRAKGGKEPMCLDKVWAEWGDAWMNKKPFKANAVGIAACWPAIPGRATLTRT